MPKAFAVPGGPLARCETFQLSPHGLPGNEGVPAVSRARSLRAIGADSERLKLAVGCGVADDAPALTAPAARPQ